MAKRCVNVAAPEMAAKTEPHSQGEYNIDIGARFAEWRHDCRSQLDEFAGLLVEAEPDAQPLLFPRTGNRQYDVGEGGGRRQIEVSLYIEFELLQRVRAASCISMRQQQVSAEP